MLNERIIITKTVETRIDGKPVQNDEDFYSCWTEINDLYGKELYEAINIKLENTIVFKIRWCKLIEQLRNKSEYKVKFKDNTYKIFNADFGKYYKEYVLLKCNLIK